MWFTSSRPADQAFAGGGTKPPDDPPPNERTLKLGKSTTLPIFELNDRLTKFSF